ncbi:hypothetical protein [Algoriphagus sp.]|uniref:hypothetical protein n=1 Tax=Algoriphagus sp. TaxID=1872435 RepID=UPI0026243E2B|nr:hypothetical protein [Algoriphagus sp.]
MKKSNKLIFGYLGFLWVSLALTLVVSFTLTPQFSFVDEVRSKKFQLSEEFSAVKIQNTSYLKIELSDSTYLEYISIHGGDVKPPKTDPIKNYRVSNDTLYIDQLQQGENGSFALHVKNLSQILVSDKSRVYLTDLTLDSLSFESPDHELRLASLDSGTIDYRSGQLFLKGSIGELTGRLKDQAWLNIPSKIGKLDIDKSESASIWVD